MITDEVLKLLETHTTIIGHFNTCFENQAANEEFQRKRTHNKYKKEIEKTRKLFLNLWLLDVNRVIHPPKEKTKVIVEGNKETKKPSFIQRIFRHNKQDKKQLDNISDIIEKLQNMVYAEANQLIENEEQSPVNQNTGVNDTNNPKAAETAQNEPTNQETPPNNTNNKENGEMVENGEKQNGACESAE